MKKLKRILALALVLCAMRLASGTALAATVDTATIDATRTASMDIYKYDVTNAEKDGVWDSSYISTGIRDESGVEALLGDTSRVTDLGNGEVSYGYALKGVEYTYLKIADIRTYTELESGQGHIEVLYGFAANSDSAQLLAAMGLTADNRYKPADQTVDGILTYYYQSDALIDGLAAALNANSTTVKNALENYVRDNGGTAMPETDAYGHTAASGLPLGLYLVVETAVPEMVTATTAPFLVSLPMTSVDGTNANNGGENWLYDVTLYPKNTTGIPTLEKTVREAQAPGIRTGDMPGAINDFAHTATASGGDVVDYQITSTLPAITSEASYLTVCTFADKLSKGVTYNKNDVVIEFFRDAGCTDLIATWTERDDTKRFSVAYGAGEDDAECMTVSMTAEGLREINASKQVYTSADMVHSGYSGCTLRLTYSATLNSDSTVSYGDSGNPNDVTLTWQRSSTPARDATAYYDTLVDDSHLFTYGIDLLKQFSDGKGNHKNVEMLLHNDTDGYYVQARLREDGNYYVTGQAEDEANATHFIPTGEGRIIVKGLEDDAYTITEIKTDNGYTLLRDDIKVVISAAESETLCDCYDGDALGLIQNDGRYTNIQPHLEHRLLTASATVDGNAVDMEEDGGSVNALAPLTVINTKGFDLPRTGSRGTWMFPVIGLGVAAMAGGVIYFLKKKGSK